MKDLSDSLFIMARGVGKKDRFSKWSPAELWIRLGNWFWMS